MPMRTLLAGAAAFALALGFMPVVVAQTAGVTALPAVSVNAPRPVAEAAAGSVAGAADFNLAELGRQSGGLSFNDAGARGFGQTISLRGLANTPFFTDPSVAIAIDDIPAGPNFSLPPGIGGWFSATVHRGPQAALRSGRAADGGVVALASAEVPSRGILRFAAGNDNLREAGLAWHGTDAGSGLDATLFAGSSRRDGYVRNTTLGAPVDDQQGSAAYLRLRCRPGNDWRVGLQALVERDRDGAQALVPLGGPLRTVQRSREGRADTDFIGLAAVVERPVAAGDLKATTSFTDRDLSPYSNLLVVFGGFDFASELVLRHRALNQEILWQGEQISAGAYASRARTTGGASRNFSGFPIEDSSYGLESQTLAGFVRGTFEPAPRWRVEAGARLESTAKDFERHERIPSGAAITRSDKWNAFLPGLTVRHELDQLTDVRLTLARGEKPGGYSAYTGMAALAGYDAQRTNAAEVALDRRDTANRWRFSGRAYANRVQGYQVERSFAVPATSTDEYLVVNAGRATLVGAECEWTLRPTPEVSVTAVAGIVHATLDDFTDPFTGARSQGTRVPYVPAGSASVGAEYRAAQGGFIAAGATWTGATRYDERETPLFTQRGYGLVQASAGYAWARGSLRLFVRNLLDRDYLSAITPGVAHGTPGAPRTWGCAAEVSW